MARSSNRKNSRLVSIILILTVVLIGLLTAVFIADGIANSQSSTPSSSLLESSSSIATSESTTVITESPVVRESSFTLSAVGDMLMHIPVINTGYYSSTGDYNFNTIFSYFSSYISAADYAVGNLETTLAGLDNGYPYSGYPQFNCPDAIVNGMKDAGFDGILTANNHTYDTRAIGLMRTQKIIREAGLSKLGTKEAADDPNYMVVERNGIRLGLACYTYEAHPITEDNPTGKYPFEQKALNGIPVNSKDAPYINSFDYHYLDEFYAEMQANIEATKEEGADAFVLFIHWGNEYQITQNATQSAIAQDLCDLGVDVIIGGHPHVVQPVELLTSTKDEAHKTVCLYSMGNAVSNQRRQNMNLKTGHTEDGVLFSVTFTRYSDGTVILEKADLLPTWVNLRTNPTTGRREYNILPLDKELPDWKAQLGLTNTTLASALASYDRTMSIVGDGMTQVNTYLAEHTALVEQLLDVRS